MAEEFIPVHEKDLGALASGRTAAKVRGIDDQGQSVNLTPAQIATMAGIDYSLLTERVVPGEYYFGQDGSKKPIYTSSKIIELPNGYKQFSGSDIFGTAIGFFEGIGIPLSFDVFSLDTINTWPYLSSQLNPGNISLCKHNSASWNFRGLIVSNVASSSPCKLFVTAKYTKQ